MGIFTAPAPGTPFGVQAPLLEINQYPLWGTYVALALYFTELAGMLMAIIAVFQLKGYSSMSRKGSVAVLASAILALLFFDMDLGRPTAGFYSPFSAILNFLHSWMARGIIFVGGLLLFSFIFMVLNFFFTNDKVLGIRVSTLKNTVAILGLLSGIFSTVYSGFELAATTGVPFWNNGALPLLYLGDGIFVGAAVSYILAFFTKGEEGGRARIITTKLLAFSSISVLASWFLFLATVNFINVFDEVAYNLLITSSSFAFDIGLTFVTLGVSGILTVPYYVRFSSSVKTTNDLSNKVKYLMLAIAVIALVAGYLTRADVLFVGQAAYQLAPMTPFQLTSTQPVPIGSFGWRG